MEYMLTFHILNVYVDKTQPHQLKYTFKVTTKSYEAISNFANEIINADILERLNKTSNADPNTNYNILHDSIERAKDAHLQDKIVKFKKHKHKKNSLKSEKPNYHKYITIKTNLKTYNTILKKDPDVRLASINLPLSHVNLSITDSNVRLASIHLPLSHVNLSITDSDVRLASIHLPLPHVNLSTTE